MNFIFVSHDCHSKTLFLFAALAGLAGDAKHDGPKIFQKFENLGKV